MIIRGTGRFEIMSVTEYYDILLHGLPNDLTVTELIHGISWTAAVLNDGGTGVAMHTPGETVPRMFETMIGMPLKEAGKAMLSWNMEEASEAFAAVNAFYNSRADAYVKAEAKTLDGIDLRGKTVGMVGKMIGHGNMTEDDFACVKKLYIMDREEKPGALPDSASEYYLPLCDLVIITGSAAINKTLPRLLELSRNAQVIMTGPSVSCCPELLKLGIDRLHGRYITQPGAMLKAIVEKRMSINGFSEPYLLEATG